MRMILQIVNIGVQSITTIPEISSTDHSRNQTTDKRIVYETIVVFQYYQGRSLYCLTAMYVKYPPEMFLTLKPF